jgi:hypothetical protein
MHPVVIKMSTRDPDVLRGVLLSYLFARHHGIISKLDPALGRDNTLCKPSFQYADRE